MSNPAGETIYQALNDNVNATVYLEGDVPDDALLPYVVYGQGDVNLAMLSISSRMQIRDFFVEVMAKTAAELEVLAAEVEEAVVGLSVVVADNITPFPGGVERAQGAWRAYDIDPSEVDGERYYRLILLFEQRETVNL